MVHVGQDVIGHAPLQAVLQAGDRGPADIRRRGFVRFEAHVGKGLCFLGHILVRPEGILPGRILFHGDLVAADRGLGSVPG